MRGARGWIAIFVSMLGVGVCLTAIVGFLLTVMHNNLPWPHGARTVRDHYLAVGQSYAQGFTAGFFLCLFLVMVAVIVSTRIAERRSSV